MEQHSPRPPARSQTAWRSRRGWPGRRAPVHRIGAPADPRFSLANERTFLAWNRTALALIGGGLVEAQLLRAGSNALRELVSLVLIGLGAVIGTIGLRRWRSSEIAMRLRAPLIPSPGASAFVGFSVGVASVLMIVVVLIDQLRP